MLLYKRFRNKKYGEILGDVKSDDEEDLLAKFIPKNVLETDG